MKVPIHLLSENFVISRKITPETQFEIYEIDAAELLCSQRLDLAAKLAYIEAKESGADLSFAKELYKGHIEAFSEGAYTEPGDPEKASLDRFYSVMDDLIESIKTGGFDAGKSLIPVGDGNVILDGAHRTACAIYFKKKVTVIYFPGFSANFDYAYFRERKVREELLRAMAVTYAKYANKELYCACIWPVAPMELRDEALTIIRQQHSIIMESDVRLREQGLRNLMLQIYRQQEWIGDQQSRFSGIKGKTEACYMPEKPTKVVLFEGGMLDEVLRMKERIRTLFQLEKHAIHISDSSEEARLMANLLYYDASRHALNYGEPDCFVELFCLLDCKKHGVCFSESATLAFYGIEDKGNLTAAQMRLNEFDPRTYFVFNNHKIPALAEAVKATEGSARKEILRILRKENPNQVVKRKLEEAYTKIGWSAKRWILRVKQVAAVTASKVGVYEKLHGLHDRIRERK